MAAIVFDTLKFVETLQEAGVDSRVAKAISTAVRDSHEAADFATKADLREMESRLEAKIGGLCAELNLIKWMMGSMLVMMLSILVKSFF